MIAGIILMVACAAYRVLLAFVGTGDWWFNFAPIAALVLCGAIYLPRKMAFTLPFAALLLSDLVLNWKYGAAFVNTEMLVRYLALAAVSLGCYAARGSMNRPAILGASVVASIWFYLVTNTASWIIDPAYTKSFLGWKQALTFGVPGLPPTWLFLRNSLLSDLLFTALFMACMSFSTAAKPAVNSLATGSPKRIGV